MYSMSMQAAAAAAAGGYSSSSDTTRSRGRPIRAAATPREESAHAPIRPRHEVDIAASTLSSQQLPQIVRPITSIRGLFAEAGLGRSAMAAAVCNIADGLIGWLLADPDLLRPSNDPRLQLSGNYAPVAETPPQICPAVVGSLPQDLNGIYIRNGPNATRLHEREGYHMFDGDGMLHGVLIRSGVASYCSRHVRTSRFIQEEIANRPLFLKCFGGLYGSIGFARASLFIIRAILGVLNLSDGWGLSNTSVCFFNGKVLSLSEEDMPYVIRVTNNGDLITLGRLQFSNPFDKHHGKRLATKNMCAHPKFDPSTGDMFAFSFKPSFSRPFYFYSVSPQGIKSRDVRIPLQEISFIHDFAITSNYVVFPDNQFVIKPWKVLRGELPVIYDRHKITKFCVIPRNALSRKEDNNDNDPLSPILFEAPSSNAYHYINAWEEGDDIVIITPILSAPEHFLEIPTKNLTCHLSEVRLNLARNSTSIKKLSNENLEFGTFNQKYVGCKTRYFYLAVGCYPELSGVVKVDILSGNNQKSREENSCNIVGRRDFGDNCHCSEPFFVERSPNKGGDLVSKKEDDGYLLCFVHNNNTGISNLVVMDAQSNSLNILASIKLPSRVPYGFHGTFIHDYELAKQQYKM